MRWCSENGAWMVSPGRNQTLADYSKCIKGMPDSREMGMYRRLSIIYTVGYSTSIISDTFALFLLTYFRRLHCTRNYIHMHLFVSFVLRGGSILVRDAILELEITGGLKPDIKNEGTSKLVALPESPNFLQLIACEISVFLYLYFLATNYFWMLVEGLYLHSLIFLTFYSRRQCFLWFFTLIGWGVPLMFMCAWATVRGTLADSRLHRCWDMRTDKAYEWIYEAPILLSIVVNFVLLANIVRVIATKLRQNNTSHRNTSQQNWKLIKSTLALMVLFGTHYVVFLGFEHKEKTMLWKIWMHYELFFSSFQGFFVSFIYCFCNGEVQTEIRRTLTHWQIAHGSLDWKIPWTVAFSIGNFLPSFTSAASSLRSSVAAVGGLLHIEHRHHTSITEASSPVLSQLMTDESFQALPKDIKQLQTKEESIICECGEEEEVKMAHVELTPSEEGDF